MGLVKIIGNQVPSSSGLNARSQACVCPALSHNPIPLPQKDALLPWRPLEGAGSWVHIFHGAVCINNVTKTKNYRFHGLMCDMMY